MFKIKNYTNLIFLISILLVVSFLYQRYKAKLDRESDKDNYDMIQKYLLTSEDFIGDSSKIKKPILWILIDHEYNARSWQSFGSRSSYDLNQPYIYLSVKSIIQHCEDSFHICLIDDQSFKKLIPNWNIHMGKIADPVKHSIRELGMMKLLFRYGGIRVPASFVCMRDLIDLYNSNNNKLFVCEMVNRNVTSVHREFYPNIHFMGSQKENPVLNEFIDFIQRTISGDYTGELCFLGELNRWCESRIQRHQINLIDGKMIGVKTMDDEPILIEQLLVNDYIDIYKNTYGIYIPADEILKRRNYEWFARLSEKQVLESRLIISKYLLLSLAPDAKMGVIEPMREKTGWVSFWKVPSGAPVWGLKPNDLGDSVPKQRYPTQ